MSQDIKIDPQLEQPKLQEISRMVLAEAKKNGASSCEVGINFDTGLATNVRMGSVENIEFNCDQGIGVTVYFGQKKGSASTANFSSKSIQDTVKAACNICKYAAEDQYAGLAEKQLMATKIMDLDLYHPWDINPNQAIELAKECEEAGRNSDNNIINSDGSSLTTHQGCSIYANSHGFMGSTLTSRHSLSAILIAGKNNNMERDYWYTSARDPLELETANYVGTKAAERALKRLGAKKKSQNNVSVVFSAEVASSIVAHLLKAISGGALYRKSSFLLDQLNKKIFPDWVHIYENPHLLKKIGSSSFDQDGLATRKKDFINEGILTNYLLSTYSARRLNMTSTANSGGVSNVFIKPNTESQQDIISNLKTGILVTELMGSSVNLVNGTYSRAASGFWIENGEIQYPISEVTIAGNLRDMFQNITAVGNDIDQRNSIISGSILIENMTLAG